MKSAKIISRRLESRACPAVSSLALTTKDLRRSRLLTKRWRRNIGPEKIRSVNASKSRIVGWKLSALQKNANYRTKLEPPGPFFYVPLRQNFGVQNSLLLRTREKPGAIMNALAREVHALDPNLAPWPASPLQKQIDEKSYSQRLAVTLVSIFGGMALFLAAIGLYAVMSYSVSQGTRELGLRMALGAGTRDLLRLVALRGLRLTTAGIVIGAIAAVFLTSLMGNLLF